MFENKGLLKFVSKYNFNQSNNFMKRDSQLHTSTCGVYTFKIPLDYFYDVLFKMWNELPLQSMLPAAVTWIYTDLEVKFNCSCKDMGKHFSRANCTWIQATYFLKACLSVLAEDEAVYRFLLKIRLMPFSNCPCTDAEAWLSLSVHSHTGAPTLPLPLEEQNYTHVLQCGACSTTSSCVGVTVDVREVTPH